MGAACESGDHGHIIIKLSIQKLHFSFLSLQMASKQGRVKLTTIMQKNNADCLLYLIHHLKFINEETNKVSPSDQSTDQSPENY